MSDQSPDDDALLRRLLARRTAPGMLDLAAVRQERARVATPGLGLGSSPLVQQLRERLGSDAGPAVAQGELVLARLLEPSMMAEAEPAAMQSVTRPPVAPAAVPSAARSFQEPPVTPADESVLPAPSASPPPSPLPVARGGAMPSADAALLPAVAVPPAAGPMAPLMPPALAPSANMPAGAEPARAAFTALAIVLESAAPTSSQPVLRLSGATPAARVAAPVTAAQSVEPVAISDQVATNLPVAESYPPAAWQQAAAAAVPAGPLGLPSASSAAASSQIAFDELTDRIARDLHRRLAVERERQGRPRWRS